MGMPKYAPDQVRQFIEACWKNAAKVWNKPDDKSFIEELLYARVEDGKAWQISDNYERFFSGTYVYVSSEDAWYYRGYDQPMKSTTFVSVMAGASIMYTG
jgi:hypothetical protein